MEDRRRNSSVGGLLVALTSDRSGREALNVRRIKMTRVALSSSDSRTLEFEVVDLDERPVAHVPASLYWPSDDGGLVRELNDETGRAVLKFESEGVPCDERLTERTPSTACSSS